MSLIGPNATVVYVICEMADGTKAGMCIPLSKKASVARAINHANNSCPPPAGKKYVLVYDGPNIEDGAKPERVICLRCE